VTQPKSPWQRWCDLWLRLAQAPPVSLFESLGAAYAEPHRAYHTWEHIQDCLTQFEPITSLAQQPEAIELALYWHDVVYDPQVAGNEERSAALAVQQLQQEQVDAATITTVHQLILATKHTVAPTNPDAILLVDVDLSILGRSTAEFDRYEANIRREYCWVPGAVYRAKRAEILEQLLQRPHIFQTAVFQGQYEELARQNLRRSLQQLRHPHPSSAVNQNQ
jgi:predicted metal-dependent HD superfamily phosphohydrolase